LICILAVDLSNVLGTGLNDLFSSLANSIPVKTEGASGGQYLAVIGITGGGALLFTMLTGPLGIISAGLCILGIIITIVVSMLSFFLVLMIRNAGIVILIAIAPIAIVCYMLPNTEKFYKKWFDLLKSLLFVYPICGALVGAGKLA
jgi:type IV secretory pathway VirB6-like protein